MGTSSPLLPNFFSLSLMHYALWLCLAISPLPNVFTINISILRLSVSIMILLSGSPRKHRNEQRHLKKKIGRGHILKPRKFRQNNNNGVFRWVGGVKHRIMGFDFLNHFTLNLGGKQTKRIYFFSINLSLNTLYCWNWKRTILQDMSCGSTVIDLSGSWLVMFQFSTV